MKVLNLYSGIGGNRKLWSNVEVTAIEISQNLADIYQDIFPTDNVIVTEAHNYLLKHFFEFDFIWSSPPCPSHSRFRKIFVDKDGGERKSLPVYPDMKLYEEIIFLQHYFKGKYVVENVMAYYQPLIKPQTVDRHWFWSNFPIIRKKPERITHFSSIKDSWRENRKRPLTTYGGNNINRLAQLYGFDLSKYQFKDIRTSPSSHRLSVSKEQAIRNCVDPILSQHIFKSAFIKPMDKYLNTD
jgi:DNA (cytosine-5)-methyltransferase 1